MVESVDTADLKFAERKFVPVRLRLRAPFWSRRRHRKAQLSHAYAWCVLYFGAVKTAHFAQVAESVDAADSKVRP